VVLRGLGGGSPARFLRGDANGDGKLDLTDPIRIIGRLFLGGGGLGCDDAADANDDGRLDLTDPVALLGRLFMGAGPQPDPGGSCGPDPTPDPLACGTRC
jgi:hypothetical protein